MKELTPEDILKAAAAYDSQSIESAEVMSRHQLDLVRLRNQNREDRRTTMLFILGGLALLVLIGGLLVGCNRSLEEENRYDERMGTVCIQAGKEWDAAANECKDD